MIFQGKKQVDASPKEFVEPAWMRIKGTEVQPLPLMFGGPTLLTLFVMMYIFDGIDTSIRKLFMLFKPRQTTAPAAAATPAESTTSEAAQTVLEVRQEQPIAEEAVKATR